MEHCNGRCRALAFQGRAARDCGTGNELTGKQAACRHETVSLARDGFKIKGAAQPLTEFISEARLSVPWRLARPYRLALA
jgi:hypothetical protein